MNYIIDYEIKRKALLRHSSLEKMNHMQFSVLAEYGYRNVESKGHWRDDWSDPEVWDFFSVT